MRFSPGLSQVSKAGVLVVAVCLCGHAQAQEAATPALKEQVKKEGMPARATAGDYLSQGKAASVTIGAEFKGHFVPTPDGLLSTDDYVVVEVGLFGAPDSRLKMSFEDFSLRLNGKK